MTANMTTFDAALKVVYTPEAIEDMVYEHNPLLAMMEKDEKFHGKSFNIPIIWANPQARSALDSTAIAAATSNYSRISAFALTHVQDYSVALIDGKTLRVSEGDEGAFMEAATTEIDGAIHALKRSLAVKMYRDSWGSIGKIATSGISGSTITLSVTEDVTNFEVGKVVVLSSSNNAAVLLNSGASITVSNVNRLTGVVTFTAGVVATIGAAADGDFIFENGDRESSATPTARCVAGLEAWVPSSAPGSTAFFGVDRSVDVTRLGGLRYNAAGVPIEEALIEASMLVSREGEQLSHFFMSYKSYSALEKALGTKVQYVDMKSSNGNIGFPGMQVSGPGGVIKIVPDVNCPSNRIFGVDLSKWKLRTAGKAVGLLNQDGLTLLRAATSDSFEARIGFYGNISCKAPGANINVQV